MSKLNKIIGIVFDFFFPRNNTDIILDKESPDTLSDKLLQARETENKSIYALFDYRDETIKNMIWSLKYRRNKHVANVFAQMLYDFFVEEFSDLHIYSDFDKPVLIPIPMHKKHLQQRGYNQTILLAKELHKIGGDSFCVLRADILQKIKNSPSQTKLHKNKRLKNIIGTFCVRKPEEIIGRSVVVLDDVTTTGATLNEARKILRKAGAKRVIGIAVAH